MTDLLFSLSILMKDKYREAKYHPNFYPVPCAIDIDGIRYAAFSIEEDRAVVRIDRHMFSTYISRSYLLEGVEDQLHTEGVVFEINGFEIDQAFYEHGIWQLPDMGGGVEQYVLVDKRNVHKNNAYVFTQYLKVLYHTLDNAVPVPLASCDLYHDEMNMDVEDYFLEFKPPSLYDSMN